MKSLSKDSLKKMAVNYNILPYELLLILSYVLKIDYSKLFFKKSYEISDQDFKTFENYIERRGRGEPIAKIIQQKEFYNFCFKTTCDTLDPRPETELIIDLFKETYKDTSAKLKILDLGSGTGCLGISLLKLYENAECLFADISPKALAIAKENALNLGVYERSEFVVSNWFENIGNHFDVIVSNPPYVADGYDLDRETLCDPKIALFAGSDGMDAYRAILPHAAKFLNPGGFLYIEIGFDQSEKIQKIDTDLKLCSVKKDLAGIDRVCVFRS